MTRGALLAAALLTAAALATSAAAAVTPVAPAHTGPGIELGPPIPSSPPSSDAATAVAGDRTTNAPFWDLPARVQDAIDGWFRGLVLDALTPSLELVGKTVLSTPELGADAQIAGLWQVSLVAADALLVLCLLLGAALAMSHQTLQTSYAVKDLLRRLVFAGIAINASLSLVDQLGSTCNALADAFLGDGASAAAAGASLQAFALQAIAGGGIFVTLLGLACAGAAVWLLILYLVRAALVVVLACAAPLLLLCHLFPQTEGLAHLWWRALAAAFGVQVAQAIVLAASLRVFFAGGAPGLGLSVTGSVVDLLLCLCLLALLVKIPLWAKELAFGRRGSSTLHLVRAYAVARVGRALV